MKINKKGFTLIEILLVIVIAALSSGLAIVNYRANDANRVLDNNAQLVASKIKETQTMALNGGLVNGQSNAEYFIQFNDLPDLPDRVILNATAGGIGDFTLDKDVDLTLESKDGMGSATNSSLVIRFTRPRADISFYIGEGILDENNAINDEEVFIVLNHANTDQKRFVVVNRISGRVDIKSSL